MSLGIIGNPENRRVKDFLKACQVCGKARPQVLSYQELLSQPEALHEFAVDFVRIDSPGENDNVTKQLIALGGGPTSAQLEFGEIAYLKEYHLGFRKLMERLGQSGLKYSNAPAEIALMFNKWECHQIFQQKELARPKAELAPSTFSEFQRLLAEKSSGRLFLKPLHGSSASGVCAYRWMKGAQVLQAPLSIKGDKLFNSLKVQRYEAADEVEFILSKLLPQQMIAEQWIPKIALRDGIVDLRILVIDGVARHRVVRQSHSPMTNLHLGNRRGDVDELVEHLGADKWKKILELAEQAAACFPNCCSVGVDILIDTHKRPWIGEVNAFGDLLPGLVHDGETAYDALARKLCA